MPSRRARGFIQRFPKLSAKKEGHVVDVSLFYLAAFFSFSMASHSRSATACSACARSAAA